MKRLLVLIVLVLLAGSLAAFDYGGYLDNTTGLARAPVGTGREVQLIQNTTVALWLGHNLGTWVLDAQGSYTFTPTVPVLFDLDRLTLENSVVTGDAGTTTFGFSAGRSTHSDTTSYVLHHTLDGIKFQIIQAGSSFRFGLGTTALLQKPTNQIILGTLDILDLSNPSKLFAPLRLIANFEYRLLDLFGGQQVNLGATIQEDLRPEGELTPVGTVLADPIAEGRFDTQYVTLGLSGPLSQGLFHWVYYTLNTGRRLEYVPDSGSSTDFSYQYQSIVAHMAGAELTYFLPAVLNSRARLFGQFSTGDTSWSDSFVPLSPSAYSDVFTLQPGNSAHVGVSYSLRPLSALDADILQTELTSVAYIRSAGSGVVSEPTVDPASTGEYVGTAVSLVLTAVPFSDLRLVLKGGLFVPNSSVMSSGNETVDYQVTLQGVLRF